MKNSCKFVCFSIIFLLALVILSQLYRVKSFNMRTGTALSTAQFYNEPRNSIDVLFFGASTTKASFLPAVIWDEAGVSSYNLSLSACPSPVMYYWLCEALTYQSPSVVFLASTKLFDTNRFDGSEGVYRSGLDNMRLSLNKISAIADVVSRSKNPENKDALSYIFPLLRYHDRDDVGREDFNLKYLLERHIMMGGGVYSTHEDVKRRKDFYDFDREDDFEINDEYLLKMVELCKQKNIEVVLISSPTTGNQDWSYKKHVAVNDWAEKNDVAVLDFNLEEIGEAINLEIELDFSDYHHSNLYGADKISRYVAHYLADSYGLKDRRNVEYDSHWDDVVDYYFGIYDKFLEKLEDGEISEEEEEAEGEIEDKYI